MCKQLDAQNLHWLAGACLDMCHGLPGKCPSLGGMCHGFPGKCPGLGMCHGFPGMCHGLIFMAAMNYRPYPGAACVPPVCCLFVTSIVPPFAK